MLSHKNFIIIICKDDHFYEPPKTKELNHHRQYSDDITCDDSVCFEENRNKILEKNLGRCYNGSSILEPLISYRRVSYEARCRQVWPGCSWSQQTKRSDEMPQRLPHWMGWHSRDLVLRWRVGDIYWRDIQWKVFIRWEFQRQPCLWRLLCELTDIIIQYLQSE